MSIVVNNIVLNIEESKDLLKSKVAKKIRIKEQDIKSFKILRESLDARKKSSLKFIYAIEITCLNEEKVVARAKSNDVKLSSDNNENEVKYGDRVLESRPFVVGMGPAGLFAALTLAKNGYNPIVIERGEDVDSRTKAVNNFWINRKLDNNSNVQFGEGGAGAFSDGKLTTRIKDTRIDYVLNEFVNSGAPKEILYLAKPHIGTDILKDVVKNIRKKIIELGGEVRFNSKLEDINIVDGKVKSVTVNGEDIKCENLILAIGHSARDTYEMLFKKGMKMNTKPFAIGVRVEHPQLMINESQYGEIYANHPRLKAAEYKLTYKTKDNRGVYSFCMCPGGVVVAASSEEERLVVNGMSYHARDKENANSALVVTVGEKDFGSHPLDGMKFQRHYESLAYKLGGSNYDAPIQTLGDFMNDKASEKLGEVNPSITTGFKFALLKDALPNYVVGSIKEAITDFDKKIRGYGRKDAIFTGIETRTSAPLRIERNEVLQSKNVQGVYPCGEGAGYAGGIMSAAVDGIKCAESIMKKYRPSEK